MSSHPNLCETSDEYLLVMMARGDTSSEEAGMAWQEFYKRHQSYVSNVIYRVSSSWAGITDVDKRDLVHEVFIKVFEKSASYKSKNLEDLKQAKGQARAWISQIAKNLAFDLLRNRQGLISESYEDEQIRNELEKAQLQKEKESSSSATPPENSTHQSLFDGLNAKERKVLAVYAHHCDPSSKQLTIPDADLEALAQEINTSKSNIRQIKKRAVDKIKKNAEDHSQKKERIEP